MTNDNGPISKRENLWHLLEALQRVAGGGVCKRVTLVAYFDAAGRCVGREEIEVVKLYPTAIFDILSKDG
jgi:hypothetical protein